MSAEKSDLAVTGRSLSTWPAAAQWAALLVFSALISFIWGTVGLPGGLLLGPMIAGIVFGVSGVRLSLTRRAYVGAQAVVGAMVASVITPAIIATLSHQALLFGFVVTTTLLAAAGLGWQISRSGLMPGATAIYGTSPGAATAMVLLSEAEGADQRLVAFMQYSRVLLVALAAALVARFWVGSNGAHTPGAPWLAAVHWGNLATVLVLALLSQQLARLVRLQAWAILGPMIVLSGLHAGGWLTIELPRWLLAAAYALIGWQIGLGFRRDALLHATKALPVIIGASLSLIAFCALVAWGLMRLAHVDALTAYLATSPGGLDTVAIIAASASQVDLPFVLAFQSVRLLLVMALAPPITRLVRSRTPLAALSKTRRKRQSDFQRVV
jgi:uncharacterized protein